MQIILNGEPRELADDTTLGQLIDRLGLAGRRYAIEIDEELVPRSQQAARVLRDGERVEIVQAIGGG